MNRLLSIIRVRTHLPLGAGVTALLLLAGAAEAQAPQGRFTVTTRASSLTFDRAASLNTAPAVGVDAEFGITNWLALGTSVSVSRPSTRKEDFITQLTFGTAANGDTTTFYQTGQQVSLVDGSIIATLRREVGRLTPYLSGGVGLYNFFLDPQINRGSANFSGTSFTGGAGVAFRLSERAGIQLDVRSLTFMNYKARQLQPSGGRFPNVLFPEEFDAAPKRKDNVSNIAFSIGFRYVPGRDIDDRTIVDESEERRQ